MSIALPILLPSISKITELLSDARDVGSAWNLFTVANSSYKSTQLKKPTMFSLPLKVLKQVADLRYLSASSPVTLPPSLPCVPEVILFVREITAAKPRQRGNLQLPMRLFAHFFRQRTSGARVCHRKPTPVNAEHTKATCDK